MSYRTTGVAFCCIAAFLFAVRYLGAAIYAAGRAAGMSSWSSADFSNAMDQVGSLPWVLSGVSLVMGMGYLVRADALVRSFFGPSTNPPRDQP